MTNKRIDQLIIEIEQLRARLNETFTDKSIAYSDTLAISQELDLLIIEYHRLLIEANRKHRGNV